MAVMSNEKFLLAAKGFRGRAKNCLKILRPKVERAMVYQYKARRLKKRHFKTTWIREINAGVRELGLNYSRFMNALPKENIMLNRRILSQLAVTEPLSFRSIVEHIKETQVVALPRFKTSADYGHVYSTITVQKIPKGMRTPKPKARRGTVNYY